MPNDIGPKIGVQGEGEFRKQIAQINTSMKTLTAETKAVTTAFIGNENSMEALTAKSELLASKSEQLNTKLDAQKARLKQLDDAGIDPTSASYQKLLQDMYNTEAALNQNEAELKKNKDAMDNFGKETKDAGDNVKKLGDNSISVGKLIKANLISDAIVGGIKALGSAIKDSVKALSGAITDSANWADDLNTLSKETGLSTEELQKLQYASGLIDVSVDTMTGSIAKLTKTMSTASSGTGDAYDAFKKLGIEIKNSDGTLRDRNEVFAETIDALGQIEDATNRDATAMAIFGKSAQDLNPLILAGGDALKQLGDEAEAAGLILEQDSVDKLNSVSDAMYKMQTATDNAKRVLAVEFAEPVAEGITKVTETIQRLVGAFSEGGLEGLADEMGRVIEELGKELEEKAPEIANALSTLIEAVVPLATQVIETIVQVLTQPDTITLLITSAGKIIAALAEGLLKALPDIFMALAQVLASLLTAIGEWMSPVLEKGREIVQKIGEGIKNAASAVVEWASDLISRFVDAVTTLWEKVKEIGTNIVTGIWEGIKEKFNWLKEKVTGFFDGIVGGVKDFLGIASPSKVFAGIGGFMAAGLGEGFEDGMKDVERQMYGSIPEPDISLSTAVGGIVNGMQGAMMGQSSNITVELTLDGTTLARLQLPELIRQASASGTPILNPA